MKKHAGRGGPPKVSKGAYGAHVALEHAGGLSWLQVALESRGMREFAWLLPPGRNRDIALDNAACFESFARDLRVLTMGEEVCIYVS